MVTSVRKQGNLNLNLLNSDASVSGKHIFLAYVVFDYRGVHLLRCTKLVQAATINTDPLLAEASALHLALVDLENRGWLPVFVQTDNIMLSKHITQQTQPSASSNELYRIIGDCRNIIERYNMRHLVFWRPRQENVLANSLVESAKREGKSVYGTDLDPNLCRIAWTQMFGAFKAHLSEKRRLQEGVTHISSLN
jgi:hypothetical protein